MPHYQSKVVGVEAIQWKGGEYKCLTDFASRDWARADAVDFPWPFPDDHEEIVVWNKLEKTWIPCPVGHFIIRGLEGEYYPCAPSVFERKYELAATPSLDKATKDILTSIIALTHSWVITPETARCKDIFDAIRAKAREGLA